MNNAIGIFLVSSFINGGYDSEKSMQSVSFKKRQVNIIINPAQIQWDTLVNLRNVSNIGQTMKILRRKTIGYNLLLRDLPQLFLESISALDRHEVRVMAEADDDITFSFSFSVLRDPSSKFFLDPPWRLC